MNESCVTLWILNQIVIVLQVEFYHFPGIILMETGSATYSTGFHPFCVIQHFSKIAYEIKFSNAVETVNRLLLWKNTQWKCGELQLLRQKYVFQTVRWCVFSSWISHIELWPLYAPIPTEMRKSAPKKSQV